MQARSIKLGAGVARGISVESRKRLFAVCMPVPGTPLEVIFQQRSKCSHRFPTTNTERLSTVDICAALQHARHVLESLSPIEQL